MNSLSPVSQGVVNIDPADDPTQFSAKKLELGLWLTTWGHITPAQLDLAQREAKRKRATLADTLKVYSSSIPECSAPTLPSVRRVKTSMFAS